MRTLPLPSLLRDATPRAIGFHLVPIALATVVLLVPVERISPFVALTWGLFMVASFTGWGIAVERWMLAQTRLDWGLRCGLGMAFVTVFAGGFLALAHLASRPVLIGMTLAGALLFANELARRPRESAEDAEAKGSSSDKWLIVAAALLFLVLCIFALGWAVVPIGNGNDDPTYHALARDYLGRGTSIQPFSFRRLCAYGGHELLLAMFIIPGTPAGFLNMFDEGLAPIILAAVVLGGASGVRASLRPLLLLAASYVLFVPVVQMNIASQGTTLVMVVIAYRALSSSTLRAAGRGGAIVAAIPLCALCALKNSNVIPAGAIALTLWGTDFLGAEPPTAEEKRRALTMLAAIAVMMAPFLTMSQISGGSPLFPLRLGNYQRDYGFMPIEKPHVREVIIAFVRNFVGNPIPPQAPQPTWILFALVLLVVEDTAVLAAFFVAPLVLCLTMAIATPNALMRDVVRYAYGFQHGVVIIATLHLVTAKPRGRSRRMVGAAIAVAAFVFQVRLQWSTTGANLVNDLTQALEHPYGRPDTDEEAKALQGNMEPGATALLAVEAPNHFDPSRQRTWNFDFLEAVTPAPHTSARAGAEPWAAYLQNVGVRYIVAMKPGAARDFYRRSTFESQLARLEYESMGRHSLAVLDAIDELSKTRAIAGQTNSMFVIDLTQRR